MSLVKSLAKWSATSNEVNCGKSDLLLRYFQSSVFDAWLALQYLYSNTQPGVHDYLCNRLHELGEEALEKYLLQFVYLAVSKPGQALERTIVDLCSKSFRIAIKTQWLLVALCQDHPRSKALEGFRERAYKAALEGKWEVPIRNPKLDPLSPFNSQLLSPPFSPTFSPGTSLVQSHMLPATHQHTHDQALPQLPQLSQLPHPHHQQCPLNRREDVVVTQPPDRIVMSPPGPGQGLSACGVPPTAGAAADAATANIPAGLTARRSGALQIDLGCLLPQESRGPQTAGPVGAGAGPHGEVAAAAASVSQSLLAPLANGHLPIRRAAVSTSGALAPQSEVLADGGGDGVATTVNDTAAVAAAVHDGVPAVCVTARPIAAQTAPPLPPAAAAVVGPVRHGPHPHPGSTYSVISAAAATLAERIQSLKRELGEGEGVSALLERSKQQGVGLVAAMEEESLFSDDEFGNRPMSPLTRLRYDTFGATLDFVDALCDASSVLTSYSQEERHRALRLGLEHINREIEGANRRDVAIWFPMGRSGDRVLRLTAKEAVLLNSREKAPFLLYVEVLEGQQECGDTQQPSMSPDVLSGTAAAAAGEGVGGASCVGGVAAAVASSLLAGGGKAPPAPMLEFGRRETYGIALTGIGAQHQQQYMHSSPGAAAAAAAGGGGASRPGPQDEAHERHPSQVGSTASGGASLPSHCAPTVDTASTITTTDTPGLSPSMSSSSQFRSVAGSPSSHAPLFPQAQTVLQQGQGCQWPPPPQQQQHSAFKTGPPAPLAAPLAVHPCTPSHAAALEEQATRRAAGGELGAAAPASGGPAAVQSLSSTLPLVASAVIIPTRSASSSNIAAAAIAATMAATSSSGADAGGGWSFTAARGNDGGGGQPQPVTPRTASNLTFSAVGPTGLPPRPPLPAGSISPINAAKEVSPQAAAQNSGGMLGASSLLRRVLGAEDAVPAGPDGGSGGGSGGAMSTGGAGGGSGGGKSAREGSIGSVVRSLCFSNHEAVVGSPEALRPDSIAFAATAAASAANKHPTQIATQPHLATAAAAAAATGPAVRTPPLRLELSEDELRELLASGCLSPPANVKSDSEVAAKLSALLASFRGEGPMVRVRIRVLPHAQKQPQHQAPLIATSAAAAGTAAAAPSAPQAAAVASHDGPRCGASGGSSDPAASAALQAPSSFSLASLGLGGRGKVALEESSASTSASVVTAAAAAAAAAGGDVGPGEKSKALALLSRLGLCRKPATDEDDDVAVPASTTAASTSAGGVPPASGGGAAAAGGSGAAAPQRQSLAPTGVVPRLLQVTFEVGQGLDLTIPSPYRKSRRTPSHEAIEMLAGKYKVLQMPPPYQCGPPLGPMSYSPSGSTCVCVRERPSEEGEGGVGGASATGVPDGDLKAAGTAELSFTGGQHVTSSAPQSTVLVNAAAAATANASDSASSSDERTAAGKASVRHSGSDGGAGAGATVGGGAVGALSEGALVFRPGGALPPIPVLHQRMRRSAAPPAPGSDAAAATASAPPPPASSGLAASLQSSLSRMLSRASGQSASEGAAQPTPTVPGKGPSPRGGSPVRSGSSAGSQGPAAAATAAGAAAAAAPPSAGAAVGAAGGSRFSRLIGGVSGGGGSGAGSAIAAAAAPHSQEGSSTASAVQPQAQASGRDYNGVTTTTVGAAAAAAAAAVLPLPYGGAVKVTDGRQERESLEERRRREANAVYGERWGAKVKRIQKESPHGCRAGWALRCVIVKSGDDCRQELLALQLVRTFGEIFLEAGLPLWVRHYEILVTSNRTALIEMVPNTLSIHTIKSRSPPGTSLSDHFFAKFGRTGTPTCTAAQRRFTESLAAYSLICYMLQIKDRHNGNILIDDDGRVVHIDFGFLLSNSPGGVNFESAPFKLTRELLEVMDSNSDGKPSEMFDYFKVLMIQGFLAVRKHGDRILLLVRMMSKSCFPCFKGGERAVKALEKRMQVALSEVQCVAHVLQLIAESLDAWRTRQYDYYQRVLNGIL